MISNIPHSNPHFFQQVGHYNYNSDGSPYQLESIDLTAVASEKYWAKHKQKVSYNTFKSPHQIEEFFDFHDESDKEQIDFTYNAFDQRSSRSYDWDPSIERQITRKYYSGIAPIELKQDILTGESKVLYFIGGDAYSAPVAFEDNYIGNAAEEDRFLYLHRDYLGTIFGITTDAGSGIGGGNDTGIGSTSPELVERRHFDAWGGLVFLWYS